MKKQFSFFLLMLLFISNISGQNETLKNAITGIIYENDSNAPLEFATISIYTSDNKLLVGGGMTDLEGKFKVEVKPGSYNLIVEFISYEKRTINNIIVKRQDRTVDVGTIKLSINAAQLDEVVISEQKSQIQLNLDKKVFNVGQDLTNKGGTAEDILDNVPSVAVDIEGNVTLRGSGGVRILIDGKPSMMVGEGNSNGLRNIPSNLIDKVEVITNPGARYEAEGMAGIINIVLKKDRKNGFNGSVDLSGGVPFNAGTSVNVNYRRNNINLFSSIGIRQRTGPGGGFSSQETKYLDGSSDIFNSQRTFLRGGLSGNVNLGMDYFINNNNILTSSFSFRRSYENNDNLTVYEDFEDSKYNLVGITDRTDDQLENEFDTEYALTYEKKFNGNGHNLIADFRFQDNTEIQSSDYVESYFDAFRNPTLEESLLQQSSNNEGERRLNFKLDYVKPISEKSKFESGIQSSYRVISNKYLVEENIENQWVRLANVSNDFNYDEFINAAYGIYSKEYTRWAYQGGLRAEYSRVVTQLLESDLPANDRSYLNLFPSAYLSYKLNPENTFQISYSRRIRRPRLWDLNPFFSFSDPRNVFSGNPDLDPEFTDSYEAGYVKYFEKGSLTSSIYYRHTKDVIERVREIGTDGVTYYKPQNLSSEDNYGFEFTGSYSFFKWWNLNGNLNLFRSITNGSNLSRNFAADTYTWFARFNNKISFSKTFEAQVKLDYRAPRKTPQGFSKASGGIDLGVGKEFPKQNISLALNVRDLLNTNRRRSINEFDLFDENDIVYGSFYSESVFFRRARQIVVSLNYRINQEKNKRKNGGNEFDNGGGGDGEMF